MRCKRTQVDFHWQSLILNYTRELNVFNAGEDIFLQRVAGTHHLLHTVPVDQSVWISEVSLVVLVISHYKLATETHTDT